MSINRSHSSSVESATERRSPIPALLHKISIFLYRSITARTIFSTSFILETSAGIETALPPELVIFSAAAFPVSVVLFTITTVAPSLTKISAIPNPIPRLPPVTIATLLANLNFDLLQN